MAFRVDTTWRRGRGVVALPDGRTIRGRALRRSMAGGPDPEFGVYLMAEDPGPFAWEHRWVRWPEFRSPSDDADAIAALVEAHERCEAERVEIACGGGVGRTGTALAVIATLAGVPNEQAVDWVRRNYHRRAVETPGQRQWIRSVPYLMR